MLSAFVALSIAGMAFHTLREFGVRGLFDPASGFLPVCGLQVLLLIGWFASPRRRRGARIALAVTAGFQLVGGAIISVLPLPFLPFEPEQSPGHYVSHVILGLTQLPLLGAAWMEREDG